MCIGGDFVERVGVVAVVVVMNSISGSGSWGGSCGYSGGDGW